MWFFIKFCLFFYYFLNCDNDKKLRELYKMQKIKFLLIHFLVKTNDVLLFLKLQ